MLYARAAIAGGITGAIGAFIWAAIAHFANAEVGWIAWGIGFLTGFAVAYAVGGETDGVTGAVAVICALLAIAAGKYVAITWTVNSAFQEVADGNLSGQDMIETEAWDMVKERAKNGNPVKFAGNKTFDEAEFSDIPVEIQREAKKRWETLSAEEQTHRMDSHKQARAAVFGAMQDRAKREGFSNSFSPFDLLWVFLAAITAWRLGSGSHSDE